MTAHRTGHRNRQQVVAAGLPISAETQSGGQTASRGMSGAVRIGTSAYQSFKDICWEGSVAEIDGNTVTDPDGYVPAEGSGR
jgi:hypothetical protein